MELGESLARDGLLNARVIGDASRTGRYDARALKRVWHYVARFGSPEMVTPPAGRYSPGPPAEAAPPPPR